MEFEKFPKIGRLKKGMVVTEKIDGTNAQINLITEEEAAKDLDSIEMFYTRVSPELWMACGSRNRYITPVDDNYGFARWAWNNHEQLVHLGPGRHFGEWWGSGIQRGYSMDKKVFSLFNTSRWLGNPDLPECCNVVPLLYSGPFSTEGIDKVLSDLRESGSVVAPGFKDPEGIVVFHQATRTLAKVTLKNDDVPKTLL